jgi:acylphosphatase
MQDPKADTHIETVHVTITGTVQGVGYRHATVRRAHMLEWLRRGPPGASVQEITTRREYTDKRYIRFEQL